MLDTQDKQEIEELVELKVKAILKENNYDINIRLVKIEEELKHQRELIQQVIHTMDKRFEDMNQRFNQLTWVMGTGFVVLGTMITAFGLFLSLAGP